MNLEKERLTKILKLYFSSVLIYGLVVCLFYFLPYYQKALDNQTRVIILGLYIGYVLIAPFYYFFFSTKDSENKTYLFLRGINHFFKDLPIESAEKVAGLFLLVKLFYLPLMFNFLVQNFTKLSSEINPFLLNWTDNWYPLMLIFLFTVDTLIFSFGYTFEFKSWNNVVKSVEPTLLGWAVALVCYPPFNGYVGDYVPWGANDYTIFWNAQWTLIFRILIILLLVIYVWASVALGFKASNLTNRGIVTKFPYSIIRHPAYVSKNLMWWLTLLPVLNWKFAEGMLFWTFIYFLRAETEERHLGKDSEYKEYCQKVKWKYLPRVY